MLYRIQRLLESHTESESSGTNHNWSDGEFAVKWRKSFWHVSRLPPLYLGRSHTSSHQYGNHLSTYRGFLFTRTLHFDPFCAITRLSNLYSKLTIFVMVIYDFKFSGWLGKNFSRLRMSTAIHTDERIRTMNEILSGMRVIKMYTWEKPFAKLIKYCRKYSCVRVLCWLIMSSSILLLQIRKEIDVIRRTNYFRSLNMSLYYISSKIIVFLTFLVYVVAGNSLSSEKVYLHVFNREF